ncbi:hypothetical protein D1872_38100 [compost metagenome]
MRTLSKLCIPVGFMISLFLVTRYYDEIGWLSIVLGVGSFFIFILLSYLLSKGRNLEDSSDTTEIYSRSHPLRSSSDIGVLLGYSAEEILKRIDYKLFGNISPIMVKLELLALIHYSIYHVATQLLGKSSLQKEVIMTSFIEYMGMEESMMHICFERSKKYTSFENDRETYHENVGKQFIAYCNTDGGEDAELYAGEVFAGLNMTFRDILIPKIKELQSLATKYDV